MPKPELGQLILPHGIQADLSDTCLFYPGSGRDWEAAAQLFLPYLPCYWFVDIRYRQAGGGASYRDMAERTQLQLLKDELELAGQPQEEMIDLTPDQIDGDHFYQNQHPFVYTAQYLHKRTQRLIAFHWYMRRGASALRNLTDRLGIFFYRGDSREGSEMIWLGHKPGQMDEVASRLVDGGLVVTDGSKCDQGHNPYRELGRFCGRQDSGMKPADAYASAQTFEDHEGC